jgi:hypothetical protein
MMPTNSFIVGSASSLTKDSVSLSLYHSVGLVGWLVWFGFGDIGV